MATINGSTTSGAWTYKLEVSESNINITNNTSNVTISAYLGRASSQSRIGGTWSGTIIVDGITQYMNGTIPWPTYINGGGWYLLDTKTFTIAHNNDGTKTVNISSQWSPESGVIPSNASANGNVTLTNIPRQAKMTDSCVSFTDEENPWFTYTNPANTSMSCWLEINPTGEHLATRTLSGTGGTFTWNLTNEERNQLRAKIPNSNTATCRIGLYSTLAGTTYSSYQDRTFRIVNADPVFIGFNYQDTNETTYYLTHGGGSFPVYGIIFVKGYSTLQVTVPTSYKAEAQKYATMLKYKVENVEANYSSDETVTLPEITNYSKNTVTVQAIDSRGNIKEKTYTLTGTHFIDYNPVEKGSITLLRSNSGVGEEVTLSYNGTWWNDNFGVIQNSIRANYKYKKTTDINWTTGTTTITPTVNGNDFSFNGIIAGDTQTHGFNINDSYNFEITVTDALSTVTFSIILGSGKPAIAVYGNKASLGDKYDTTLGGTQLWGDVYVNRNVIGGTVLFEYSGQSSITLNDTITNYKAIEIYAKRTDGTNELFPVQKFYTNNENQVMLLFNAGYNVNGGVYIAGWQININGTNFTSGYFYKLLLVADSAPYSPSSTTNVRILKIIGYK